MTTDSSDNNTYIFDPESPVEMGRLIDQDRLLTRAMGGPLAGLSASEIAELRNVLDLGCGPGGWVLDVAFEHPEMEVAGVDISSTMIDYANARARTQQLANASFGVMDITKTLDFPDASFDLVNARFLFWAMRRENWPPFIADCTRLLRPGGILRLTEPIDIGITNGLACEEVKALLYRLMWRAGYGFSVDGRTIGITYMLPRLLQNAGYQNIQFAGHALSAAGDAWADCYHNVEVGYYQSIPLLVKAGLVSQEEGERLYQQTLIEWHGDDFAALWHYMSFRGTSFNPKSGP